jgi:hypothetical protein
MMENINGIANHKPHSSSVMQLMDVGINKELKYHLMDKDDAWF